MGTACPTSNSIEAISIVEHDVFFGHEVVLQIAQHFPGVYGHVHSGQCAALVKLMMNEGNRLDPVLAFLDRGKSFVLQISHVWDSRETADHVEVVFHPVVDLLHKDFFYFQQFVLFFELQYVFLSVTEICQGAVLAVDLGLFDLQLECCCRFFCR